MQVFLSQNNPDGLVLLELFPPRQVGCDYGADKTEKLPYLTWKTVTHGES